MCHYWCRLVASGFTELCRRSRSISSQSGVDDLLVGNGLELRITVELPQSSTVLFGQAATADVLLHFRREIGDGNDSRQFW